MDMDYLRDLPAFHGVIVSANHKYSFVKVHSRGGNQEKVEYITEKLKQFLQDKNYITENGVVKAQIPEFRKLALYLALNADLPCLEEMAEMEGLDIIIWMIPTLTKFLLSEIFWNLHMEQFLHEIISYCSPRLALEFADVFVSNLKYLNPVTQLGRVRLVSAALYQLVCRLHFYRGGDNPELLTMALNSFQNCLKNFTNPPNATRVLNLHKDEQYKYLGRSLGIMLNLLEECLTLFLGVQQFEADGFNDVYFTTHQSESIATRNLDFNICDSPNIAILECLNKCNACLLDDCTTQVMSISVDIFCAWSEYEENGKSMQQSIGELCFKVRSTLQRTSGLAEHALVGMLAQLARAPVEQKDLINDTDIETIVAKINAHDEESAGWLGALLYKDDLCQNLTLLLLMESNLSLFNEEQCSLIFTKITRHLKEDQENGEYLKALAINAFRRCDVSTKESLMSDQFINSLHDELENSNFIDMMTEIFNKLTVCADADPSDIMTVFLQNPRQVYIKIIKTACENAEQTDIMLKAINCLNKFYSHYYKCDTEPCLVNVTHGIIDSFLDTDRKQIQFVNFISELKRRDAISPNRLLIMIITANLHKWLLKKDVVGLKVQIMLLLTAFSASELVKFRAPLLALMARVMEVARWKLTTYRPGAPDALDAVIKLVKQLFDTYEGEIPERDLSWLSGRVRGLQPLNIYHYRRLRGAAAPTGLLRSVGLPAGPPNTRTAILVQVLCSLSAQEWKAVLEELGEARGSGARAAQTGAEAALGAVHAALLLIAGAERTRRTEGSWGCLINCYNNYSMAIRTQYLKEPLTDEQMTSVVNKVVDLVNLADDSDAKELAMQFFPLLAHVAEKGRDLPAFGAATHFIQLTVKSPAACAVFNRLFTPGTV